MYKHLKKTVDWACTMEGYRYKIPCPSWVSIRVNVFIFGLQRINVKG